ncbi:MAG TPA: GWxTD domain-containing protein [Thermoanaerobaculia bacterium]|nr:GWxTD domain-containing protein [Thermoanaerobaculia bacterium]
MICFATIRRTASGLVLSAAMASALACGSSAPRVTSAADLTNPFLGPETSSWLIGPIARIATPEEIKAYLALTDDARSTQFIDQFWAKRDPNPAKPGNPLRETFDERAAEADRQFSEAGYRGRRTDRGTTYVLYGPPSKTDHDISPAPGEPPVETWTYNATTPAGLDGRKPSFLYRFIKRGDLTVRYIPRESDPRLRRQQGLPPPE